MTNPKSTVSTTLSLKLREKLDVYFHLSSLVMTTVISYTAVSASGHDCFKISQLCPSVATPTPSFYSSSPILAAFSSISLSILDGVSFMLAIFFKSLYTAPLVP